MDMHLRVWSLNYRHMSRAEAYAFALLSMALREPLLPQWPLPGGVADFAIPTAGIILEIDDKSHNDKREKDIAKRAKWEKSGWLVVSCNDTPNGIMQAVAGILNLINSLPALEVEMDSKDILGGRVVLREDYYSNMAAKRKAKKARKDAREAKASSNEIKPPRTRQKAKVGGGEKEAPRSTKKAA